MESQTDLSVFVFSVVLSFLLNGLVVLLARMVLAKGIRGYLKAEYWAYERTLPRH